MKFEIITLFPDYFNQALRQSLLGKATEKQLFEIEIINLRDFAVDRHKTVDDTPFGGGGGMVMKVEPLDRCLTALGYDHRYKGAGNEKERIILTSASGVMLDQPLAIKYSLADRLTIICGHYLGVDERLTALYDIDEVSIGDYILSGGEPAGAVIVDAVARLIPGVLGNFESALNDSFMNQILGAPCYTRPAEYKGLKVPETLLKGNHAEIEKFRRCEALKTCVQRRPDLIKKADLTDDEIKMIRKLDEKIEID
ncbi:MAG: tRNA (guanosine(37)-N1)-methyltransferase TrmD [candidate division Zixibacteria bacterium]|nr:tRNA (guanosine(37)-N1)-methyltransferase TrmD [candidate division Zixibacteria bacterium]